MPRSPIWDRRELGSFYWKRDTNSGPGADINNSIGVTANAKLVFSLFKGGGRSEKADDIVKGRELGDKIKAFISSIDVEEDESMTTKLTLTMQNVNYVLSQSQAVTEGDACFVDLGYGTQTWNRNGRFVFVRSHPHFTRDGIPTIQFIGYDGRFAMIGSDWLTTKRSRQLTGGAIARGRRKGLGQAPSVYKNQRDDQIIDRIAYHYGFSIDVDRVAGARTRVKKKKTSDWEFIRKIAEKRQYTAWVDWDDFNQTYCIHYREKPGKFDRGYVFHYGTPTPKDMKQIERTTENRNGPVGTLLEFHPTLDTTKMITDIEVIHFDRRERYLDNEWLSYQDKSLPPPPPDPDSYDYSGTQAYGALLKFKVGGRVIQTWSNRPFKNKKQAKEYAFNLVNKFQADFMTARGTIIGTPDIRPRQVHRLTGIGRYSGDYYTTQVTHHYKSDGFYETEFVAYRLLDETLPGLIRRGQITQRWAVPLITPQGIIYPGS